MVTNKIASNHVIRMVQLLLPNGDSNSTAVDTVRTMYVQVLDIYRKYQKYGKISFFDILLYFRKYQDIFQPWSVAYICAVCATWLWQCQSICVTAKHSQQEMGREGVGGVGERGAWVMGGAVMHDRDRWYRMDGERWVGRVWEYDWYCQSRSVNLFQ